MEKGEIGSIDPDSAFSVLKFLRTVLICIFSDYKRYIRQYQVIVGDESLQ